jgi:hypothetical protein
VFYFWVVSGRGCCDCSLNLENMTPSRDPHKARGLGSDHALIKPKVEIPEVRSMIGVGGVPSDAFAEGKH